MPPMTTSDDLHVLLNANPKGAREALIASYRRQLVKGRMAPVDNDGEMGGTPMRCSVFCVAGFAYVTLTQGPLCGPKYHWTDRSRICVCVYYKKNGSTFTPFMCNITQAKGGPL